MGHPLFIMETKNLVCFNLKKLNNWSNNIDTGLDISLTKLCDEALQHGSRDGLVFVGMILQSCDLVLENTRKRYATSVMLYNQLTQEQLDELRKEDENVE